jgi:hypothetical protein
MSGGRKDIALDGSVYIVLEIENGGMVGVGLGSEGAGV